MSLTSTYTDQRPHDLWVLFWEQLTAKSNPQTHTMLIFVLSRFLISCLSSSVSMTDIFCSSSVASAMLSRVMANSCCRCCRCCCAEKVEQVTWQSWSHDRAGDLILQVTRQSRSHYIVCHMTVQVTWHCSSHDRAIQIVCIHYIYTCNKHTM